MTPKLEGFRSFLLERKSNPWGIPFTGDKKEDLRNLFASHLQIDRIILNDLTPAKNFERKLAGLLKLPILHSALKIPHANLRAARKTMNKLTIGELIAVLGGR